MHTSAAEENEIVEREKQRPQADAGRWRNLLRTFHAPEDQISTKRNVQRKDASIAKAAAA